MIDLLTREEVAELIDEVTRDPSSREPQPMFTLPESRMPLTENRQRRTTPSRAGTRDAPSHNSEHFGHGMSGAPRP